MKKYQPLIIAVLMASFLVSTGFSSTGFSSTNSTYAIKMTDKSQKVEASGNVSINLKVYKDGKVKKNIAFVVVNRRTTFNVESDLDEEGKAQPLSFGGELSVIDEETYLLNYGLSQTIANELHDSDQETTEHRTVGWNTSVEIEKGKEVVLMKEGDIQYTLLITAT